MDKAARLSIPEIGTKVSQCELSSLLPTSPFMKQGTQSFSFSILLQSLWESSPCFICFFLSPSFSSSHSLPPFFSFTYFERPNFQRVSLGATPQMKWHTVEKTERRSVAWPETEFPWRLLLGATQAIVARQRRAGVRLHLMGLHSDFFIRW